MVSLQKATLSTGQVFDTGFEHQIPQKRFFKTSRWKASCAISSSVKTASQDLLRKSVPRSSWKICCAYNSNNILFYCFLAKTVFKEIRWHRVFCCNSMAPASWTRPASDAATNRSRPWRISRSFMEEVSPSPKTQKVSSVWFDFWVSTGHLEGPPCHGSLAIFQKLSKNDQAVRALKSHIVKRRVQHPTCTTWTKFGHKTNFVPLSASVRNVRMSTCWELSKLIMSRLQSLRKLKGGRRSIRATCISSCSIQFIPANSQ